MKRTPLHDVHVALGAKMVEFGGWHMPVQYGPILEEVRCVRERAGLFDLGHMGRVELRGAGALAFLDRMLTNHCARIPVGSIRYGLLCRPDGTPIDDLLVYRDEASFYLVVNASNSEVDLAWLREHAAGAAVEIDDQTARTTMIALQGPRSAEILSTLARDIDLARLGYYRFGYGTVCGLPRTRISRTGYTGEDGFEVYFPNAEAGRIWEELLAAGEGAGLRPIGLGARDTLRLEAGMALYGHEIDERHDPIQAGLAFAVSFEPEKGDWIGRTALQRIAAHPTRKLIGITTAGPRVPRQGYALLHEGEPVGEVVSGAVSPTLGTNIGTAYVPLELSAPGTSLEMDVKGKRQACLVRELPFYSRTRKAKA